MHYLYYLDHLRAYPRRYKKQIARFQNSSTGNSNTAPKIKVTTPVDSIVSSAALNTGTDKSVSPSLNMEDASSDSKA